MTNIKGSMRETKPTKSLLDTGRDALPPPSSRFPDCVPKNDRLKEDSDSGPQARFYEDLFVRKPAPIIKSGMAR